MMFPSTSVVSSFFAILLGSSLLVTSVNGQEDPTCATFANPPADPSLCFDIQWSPHVELFQKPAYAKSVPSLEEVTIP